jgi:hypothetical protein
VSKTALPPSALISPLSSIDSTMVVSASLPLFLALMEILKALRATAAAPALSPAGLSSGFVSSAGLSSAGLSPAANAISSVVPQ